MFPIYCRQKCPCMDRGVFDGGPDIIETWNLKHGYSITYSISRMCIRNQLSPKDPTWNWWIGARGVHDILETRNLKHGTTIILKSNFGHGEVWWRKNYFFRHYYQCFLVYNDLRWGGTKLASGTIDTTGY